MSKIHNVTGFAGLRGRSGADSVCIGYRSQLNLFSVFVR